MTTYNLPIEFQKDLNIVGNAVISGEIEIQNYTQPTLNEVNFLKYTTKIIENIVVPEIILDIDSLFIKNLHIESENHSEIGPSFFINKANTQIDNTLLISDKYNSVDIEYYNDIFTNNFNINNSVFNANIYNNLYLLNKSLIKNNFTLNNNYIYNDIIFNRVINKKLIYNKIIIKDNINIEQNFNCIGNLFVKNLKIKDIIVRNINISNVIKVDNIVLPRINKNINNTIGYNTITNSLFFYLNNNYYNFQNKLFNIKYNTGIIQNYPTINFIQNGNIILNINDISKNININSNNVIVKNNLNIKKNLFIFNNLNDNYINNLNIDKKFLL